MPKYVVKSPFGTSYAVNAPEGATEQDVISYVQQQLGILQEPVADEGPSSEEMLAAAPVERGFGRSLSRAGSRGFSRIGSMFTDIIPALAGSAVGADEYARQQMEEAAAKEAELQRYNPAQFPSFRDVKGIGDVLPFIGETIGEQGANIAATIGTGGVSSLVGRTIARRAAQKQLDDLVAAQVARKTAEARAKALPTSLPIRQAAAEAAVARRAPSFLGAAGSAGAETGAIAGALGSSVGLNASEIFQNIYQNTGELAPAAAILGGGLAGALDSILPVQVLKAFKSSPKSFQAEVIKKIGERKQLNSLVADLAGKTALGIGKGVATEAATEAAQESISIAAENFVRGGDDIWGSEEFDRILESAVRGGIAGGGFGAAPGVSDALRTRAIEAEEFERRAPPPPPETPVGTPDEGTTPPIDAGPIAGGRVVSPEPLATPAGAGLGGGRMEGAAPVSELYEKAVAELKRRKVKLTQRNIKNMMKELGLPTPKPPTSSAPITPTPVPETPAPTTTLTPEIPASPLAAPTPEAPEPTTTLAPEAPVPEAPAPTTTLAPETPAPETPRITLKQLTDFGFSPKSQAAKVLVNQPYATPEDLANLRTRITEKVKALGQPSRAEAFLQTLRIPEPPAELPVRPGLNIEVAPEVRGVDPFTNIEREAFRSLGRAEQERVEAEKIAQEDIAKDEAKAQFVSKKPAEGGGNSEDQIIDLFDRYYFDAKENKPGATQKLAILTKRYPTTAAKISKAAADEGVSLDKYFTRRRSGPTVDTQGSQPVITTPAQLRNTLKKYLRREPETEFIKLVPKAPEYNELTKKPIRPRVAGQAIMDGPYAWLYANRIRKGEEISVFMHEVGAHVGMRALVGKTNYDYLISSIKKWAEESSDDLKNKIARRALNRIPSVTPAAQVNDEVIAYFITEAIETYKVSPRAIARTNTPLGKFFKYVLQGVRDILNQIGLSGYEPTAQDIVDLAYGAAQLQYDRYESSKKIKEDLNKRYIKPETEAAPTKKATAPTGSPTPAYKNFIDDFESATSENPFDTKSRVFRQSALIRISKGFSDSDVHIHDIRALTSGGGADALEQLKSLADKHGVTLTGTAKAYAKSDIYPMSTQKLRDYYKKRGFSIKRGNASDGYLIEYKPKKPLRATEVLSAEAATDEEAKDARYTPPTKKNYSKFVNFIDNTIKEANPAVRPSLEFIVDLFTNLSRLAKRAYLSLLSLTQIAEVVETFSPTLADALKSINKIAANRNVNVSNRKEQIENFILKARKVVSKYDPKIVDKLYTFMHESSIGLVKFDIDKRHKAAVAAGDEQLRKQLETDYARVQSDPKLKKLFDDFEKFEKDYPELSKLYYDLRDEYKKLSEEFTDALNKPELLGAAGKTLNELMKKRIDPYFPLYRRGDYWVRYITPDGEKGVSAFQEAREAREFVRFVQANNGVVEKEYIKPTEADLESMMPLKQMQGVIKILKEKMKGDPADKNDPTNKARDEILEGVYAIYLDMFSNQSVMQAFNQRKGRAGYRNDALANFSDVGTRMAINIEQFNSVRKIDESISKVMAEAENLPSEWSDAVKRTIKGREASLKNPVQKTLLGRFASAAGHNAYRWFILGNMSSAIINLTQLPIVVAPMLGGKFGWGKTISAMNEARKMYWAGGQDDNTSINTFGVNLSDLSFAGKKAKLSEEYQKLYSNAVQRGAIRRSTGQDLMAMRNIGVADPENKMKYKQMQIEQSLGWAFQNAERFNREVTLLAAYKLAKESGMSEAKATDYALDLIEFSHGNAMSELGPEALQTGFGKLFGVFKRFALNQIYLQYRLVKRAFAGADPGVKKEAFKQFMGINAAAFAFAGLKGMPVYGGINLLASMFSGLFGDDDEPFDLDEAMLATLGSAGFRGPIGAMLNLNLGTRTGFGDLLWRPDEKRLAELGLMAYAMEQAGGPAVSIINNLVKGTTQAIEGDFAKGMETALPSVFKSGFRSFRFATEGVVNSKGFKIVDDPSAMGVLMSLIGFTPNDVNDAYSRVAIMKGFERAAQERRNGLLDELWAARQSDDYEGVREINKEIYDFNRSKLGRSNPITSDTRERSYSMRKKRESESIYGASFNPKLVEAAKQEAGVRE